MSKFNFTPKKAAGKSQSKRPKLDFSAKPSHSCLNDTGDSVNDSSKSVTSNVNYGKQKYVAHTSEWDDDEFSGDMLEEVCMIADLSQAMVKNYPKAQEATVPGPQRYGPKCNVSERKVAETKSPKLFENLESIKLENEKLLEIVKTKEGEVQILRSQLKQNQEAKEAEALNNKKILKEVENNYNEKIEAKQKEIDAMKTELEFRQLEIHSLKEKYKELETNTTKIKLIEPQAAVLDSKISGFSSSQIILRKGRDVEIEDSNISVKEPINFRSITITIHEGRKFGNLLCPNYFNCSREPSIISFFKINGYCDFHVSSLDFDKREKYKWSGLPKQTTFINDTYNHVSKLFWYENFNDKGARDVIESLLSICSQILQYQRDLLKFLVALKENIRELNDPDYLLLENENEVNEITLNHLLDGKKINDEEYGIETRRVLGMIVALILSSESALNIVMANSGFEIILKEIAVSIGNLRKPTYYPGILAAISLFLAQILNQTKLEQELITILNEIVKELIFARPKLDVLALIIEALAAGKNHLSFVQALCTKGCVESCALYMDSKLHQAMFFTKDACPLKLLCTQILGLSCIPVNRKMKWSITCSMIKWLNRMMDAAFSQQIKWLPTYFLENEDKCFDVMECFSYLLNSCLKDYLLNFNVYNERCSSSSTNSSDKRTAISLLSIIGDGCLLFRRIIKFDQRLLLENSHNLRFGTLLKSLNNLNGFYPHQREAASWIIELVESDLKNQESFAKQKNFSDRDVIDALKLNDDFTIF